jgi:two-component system, NarL family, nitrate/nitrite response regulator NarL
MASSVVSASQGREHATASSQRIGLLVSDDNAIGCQLLKNALTRSRSRFSVVGCAVTHAGIFDSMKSQEVDIALINENLEDGPLVGFRVLSDLRISYPKTRTIILVKSARHDLVVDAFRGGAKGVFCRGEPLEVLCKCIQSVHKGQIWANSTQLQNVLDALVSATPLRTVNFQRQLLLTKREDEVVNLVVDGLTNRQVAQKLGLTEHTVSNYLFRIYEKLGISSRVELVLYTLKQKQQVP